MSFFNAIKRSFGFGEDIDDELLTDSSDQISDSEADAHTAGNDCRPAAGEVSFDPDKASAIFTHVVDIFNRAMPEFLSKSVDPEAQRRQLYDSLDTSIKDYLEDITTRTRQLCETQWQQEKNSMRGEMESLKAKAKEIEQQRMEIKQQQLSSDRQRRALSDRVHDLENQLSSSEAEREQLDLENKSLVNKLKVAAVHETEAETLRNDLSEAQAEIIAMRNTANVTPDEDSGTVAQLQSEIDSLNKQLAEAAEKDRISSEMFNSLRSKASSARSELDKKDEEINALKAKLAEAEENNKDIENLSRQMSMIEEAIDKRDRKIAKLKETCESLKAENAELKASIADNLSTQARNETRLRERITELEAGDATSDTPKISDRDLEAIEESFESDWMCSEPAETPSMRTGLSENEFGYQNPVRKTPPSDNDAQLSLF